MKYQYQKPLPPEQMKSEFLQRNIELDEIALSPYFNASCTEFRMLRALKIIKPAFNAEYCHLVDDYCSENIEKCKEPKPGKLSQREICSMMGTINDHTYSPWD